MLTGKRKSLPNVDKLDEFLHRAIDMEDERKHLEAVGFYQQGLDLINESLKSNEFNVDFWPIAGQKLNKLKNFKNMVTERLKRINDILSSPYKNESKPSLHDCESQNTNLHRVMRRENPKLPPRPLQNSVPRRRDLTPTSSSTSPGIFGSLAGRFFGGTNSNKKKVENKNYVPKGTSEDKFDFGTLRRASKRQQVRPRKRLPISQSPYFKGIKKEYISSILDEILDKGTSTSFEDIAGLSNAKQVLTEAVILPQLRPDLFSGLRGPPKGVLLFGAPGNGKTLLAKAIATECDCKFFAISASSLVSKWHGESEKLARALFASARYLSPSIIFIDEIDSILSSRSSNEHEASRRLKTEFLVQIDGVNSSNDPDCRVLVLGATNVPFDLDDAILRRFMKRVYITLPDKEARKELIKKILDKHGYQTTLSEKDFDDVADHAVGYSGSDLAAVCRDSSMVPLRELGNKVLKIRKESIRKMNRNDFMMALKKVKKSTDEEVIKRLDEWNKNFGSS